MNKKLVLGVAAIMTVTSANAGWFDFLGLGSKETEPTTLAEACNKDEISKFCPEVLLGEKTIPTCLVENVKSVSKKCAKFIKKSIKEQAAEVKETVETVKSGANETANEKVNEVVAKKNAAVATAKEIQAAAKQVGQDAKETGEAFKGMFNAEEK